MHLIKEHFMWWDTYALPGNNSKNEIELAFMRNAIASSLMRNCESINTSQVKDFCRVWLRAKEASPTCSYSMRRIMAHQKSIRVCKPSKFNTSKLQNVRHHLLYTYDRHLSQIPTSSAASSAYSRRFVFLAWAVAIGTLCTLTERPSPSFWFRRCLHYLQLLSF